MRASTLRHAEQKCVEASGYEHARREDPIGEVAGFLQARAHCRCSAPNPSSFAMLPCVFERHGKPYCSINVEGSYLPFALTQSRSGQYLTTVRQRRLRLTLHEQRPSSSPAMSATVSATAWPDEIHDPIAKEHEARAEASKGRIVGARSFELDDNVIAGSPHISL